MKSCGIAALGYLEPSSLQATAAVPPDLPHPAISFLPKWNQRFLRLRRLAPSLWFRRHIVCQRVGQSRNGKGLQPYFPRTGKRGQENSIAAEDHVSDSGNSGNLEGDTRLECADVAGVHAQGLSGAQLSRHHFA